MPSTQVAWPTSCAAGITCRFPGCDEPADCCDLTTPFPTRWGRPAVKHEVPVPKTPPAQDLWTGGGIDNCPTAPSSGPAPPGTPTPPIRPACTCSRNSANPPPPCGPATAGANHRRPRRDDAQRRHTRAHTPPKPSNSNANSTTHYVAERNKPPPFYGGYAEATAKRCHSPGTPLSS